MRALKEIKTCLATPVRTACQYLFVEFVHAESKSL